MSTDDQANASVEAMSTSLPPAPHSASTDHADASPATPPRRSRYTRPARVRAEPKAPAPAESADAPSESRPTATAPGSTPAPPASPADPVAEFHHRRAETRSPDTPFTNRRSSVALGDVVIVAAGRGGVGKSTMSLALADRAAEAGLATVVVDANRGQADIRSYLRLPRSAPLPTAYDAFATADASTAVLRPADFATYRQQLRLGVPDFALVLGPPAHQASSALASARVYGDVIDHARSIADLVIVDASIMYAEPNDLWSQLHTPLLHDGAWMLALSSEDPPALTNLEDRLQELRARGVDSARTLLVATRFEDFTDQDELFFTRQFGSLGSFVGHTAPDSAFHDAMNIGEVQQAAASPAVAPTLSAVLLRITGRADLFTEQETHRPGALSRIGRRLTGGGSR